MKTRSSISLCAPLALFAMACVASVPTLVLAFFWMGMGMCAVGYRTVDQFPNEGIRDGWQQGTRGWVTHFYHVACWPRYVREDVSNAWEGLLTSFGSRRKKR